MEKGIFNHKDGKHDAFKYTGYSKQIMAHIRNTKLKMFDKCLPNISWITLSLRKDVPK